jgi:hypothetical protein
MKLLAYVLLLIGGLVHTFPKLYETLSGFTGGQPIIQITVGILSVLIALYLMFTPSR